MGAIFCKGFRSQKKNSLPTKVSHVNEMRNLDHRATREYGIPQEILMENAGQAAYYDISKDSPPFF